MRALLPIALALAGCAGLPEPALDDPSVPWHYGAGAYVWATTTDGSVTANDADATLDPDLPGDVAPGLVLHFEARQDGWSFIVDPAYITAEGEDTVLGEPAEIETETLFVDAKLGYRISPIVDLLAGVRYTTSETAIDLAEGSEPIEQSRDWWDPLVGARAALPLSERWSVESEADVGGFGSGDAADLTWNVTALMTWTVAPPVDLAFGYRILAVDVSEAEDTGTYTYDALTSGPLFGASLSF